jgi:hypothetical protein
VAVASTEDQRRKNLGRPWKPGQSGNPSGRSRAADELRKALEQDAPHARQRLRELLDSDDESIALRAAEFVIDHVKGRPTQAVTGEDGGPVQIDLGVVDMLRKLSAP